MMIDGIPVTGPSIFTKRTFLVDGLHIVSMNRVVEVMFETQMMAAG